jgi:uncharacterized damage-inducible protein DinB
MQEIELNQIALEALRRRITKILPAQVRSCIEQLSEEQMWWRPNEESNSVGNLVLHISGSMLHFLCRGVGGFEYQRDRTAEFAERGPMSKQRLLALFDETIEKAVSTFDSLDASRLTDASSEPAYYTIIFEDLLGVGIHLATHTGQIVYVTKMLKEGSLDDLWSSTHRQHGGWKT